MITSLKRIIKSGCNGSFRNMGLSLATIFVMIIAIFIVTLLYFLNPVSNTLISDVQQKVDVSIYFKEDVLSEDILQVKSEITKMAEVQDVEYISKEDAFNTFVSKHKDDPVLIESLTEVGYNPFLASLSIRAREASQYEQLASLLETGPFKDMVDNVDYAQRKSVIEKVFAFTDGAKRTAVIFSIIFGAIAVLVAFSAIKIAIHNSLEEISVMRLVGASNWFVRGPFVIQGIVIGLVATIITFILTFITSYSIDPSVSAIIPDISVFGIFTESAISLFLIQAATGTGLGVVSSLIAVRKYLKI